MKRIIFAIIIATIFQGAAAENSPGLHLKSGNAHINLIELYSSEGCSSCPPADFWLSSLRKEKKLWKNFVPVEFHVDYWDNLGWKDPYANPEFTQRQKDYAKLWRNRSIYTPGIVLNGLEWDGWRNPEALSKVEEMATGKGNLEVSESSKRNFVVKFTPSSKASENYTVYMTLLGNSLTSNVNQGENSGVNLKHDFVVLSYKTQNLKKDGASYTADIDLSKEKISFKPQSFSLAVWVTGKDKVPIQAVGGTYDKR